MPPRLRPGDIDNDGFPDLFVANDRWVPNELHMNQGNCAQGEDGDVCGESNNYPRWKGFERVGSGFGCSPSDETCEEPSCADDSRAAAFGDVDADGFVDLFVANALSDNQLYMNVAMDDGSRTFALANRTLAFLGDTGSPTGFEGHRAANETTESRGVTFGDVNGDGHLDIFVANAFAENDLYINNRSGFFVRCQSCGDISAHTTTANSAVFGDLDGDGDLDLFIAENGVNGVYLNDGTGYFAGTTLEGFGSEYTYGAALGDLDGDGEVDMFVVRQLAPPRMSPIPEWHSHRQVVAAPCALNAVVAPAPPV